jgi:hypothetical protein
LHRDASTINVKDVFGLFVFQPGSHRPGRDADPDLERIAQDIAEHINDRMGMSLSSLFRAAEEGKETALPSEPIRQPRLAKARPG